MLTANPPVAAASHPLDPLTAGYPSFHLEPDGFFDGDPALDVPPVHLSHGDGHRHGN